MMIVTDTKTGTVVLSQTDATGREHIVLGSASGPGEIPTRMVMEAAAELLPFSDAGQHVN